MELTGILFLVVILIMLTLFIFGLVKGFSGWGVAYTVVLVFTFLSCLAFLFASAGVASRRIAWVRLHDRLKEQVGKLEVEARQLTYGDLYRPAADLSALVPLANEVSRLTVERGRTWRGASLTDFNPDSVRLSLAAKAANEPPAAGERRPKRKSTASCPPKALSMPSANRRGPMVRSYTRLYWRVRCGGKPGWQRRIAASGSIDSCPA